ncbi:MAG: hypothetical protein FJX72_18270 [Armatimonadetes bacterium]|nr:hypothetical protein [Armatimonadota bacterium]
MDAYHDAWCWYNVVWDTRRGYPADRLPIGYADGHAATISREKFVGWHEAPTKAEYCRRMEERGLLEFWGRAWRAD